MKLDMLFFLGVFFTIIGSLVLAGLFFGGTLLNLYGAAMLIVGLVLVIWRPKPSRAFFLGRARPEETKPRSYRCVCGRMLDSGESHVHGYDEQKGYYNEERPEGGHH